MFRETGGDLWKTDRAWTVKKGKAEANTESKVKVEEETEMEDTMITGKGAPRMEVTPTWENNELQLRCWEDNAEYEGGKRRRNRLLKALITDDIRWKLRMRTTVYGHPMAMKTPESPLKPMRK